MPVGRVGSALLKRRPSQLRITCYMAILDIIESMFVNLNFIYLLFQYTSEIVGYCGSVVST